MNNDICNVRFLELNIWNDYLGKNRKQDILVYHMKDENKSNSSFLIKSQQEKTSVSHLFFYAGVVIYLALLANFVFSFIPLRSGLTKINWSVFWITTVLFLIIPLLIFIFLRKKKK